MERKRVNSSKIRSVGYDERDRLLEVELNDGSVFQYSGVSPEVHRRMMSAPSMVSFYQDKIEEDFSRKRLR
jgi:YD repeat-containing protein